MSADLIDDERDEVERYELRQGPAYRFDADRREFVQVLGAGLVIAVGAGAARGQRGGRGRGRGGFGGEGGTVAPGRRFHIDADGVVTAFTSKVEAGQGSRTQLTQALAEELFVPVAHIRLVMADTEQCPDDGGTAGSRTTPATVPSVRRSAAQAREILAALAAAKLGVERGGVTIADGAFSDAASGKTVTLAELAADAEFAAKWSAAAPVGEAAITPVGTWRVLGTPVNKVTGRDVVTGAHKYPSDIVRPGMLHGQVLRPDSLGARLESLNADGLAELSGVTLVRDGNFVGVAAPTTHAARKAIAALAQRARWTAPDAPANTESLFEHLKATSNQNQARARQRGDGAEAFPRGTKPYQAEFQVHYIQHAPMEPRAAVAEWVDGKLTVWTGSQQPSRVQSELMQAFRLPAEQVRVIVPDMGGGFGGKHSGEAAVEAARLAKSAGQPVSLRWTREEEFTWAYCRPAGLIEVRASLDERGRLRSWDFTNYNSGESALESPYEAPNSRTRFVATDSPLRQGSYRALASTANTFARESAIDELAQLAEADPLEFRLAHLPDGRLKDVLVAAAEKFQWRQRRPATNQPRGVGLACGTEKGSFVAACAEVEFANDQLRIVSICQAYECGAIQNPANLRAQVHGAIVQGLGGALWEQVRFEFGRVTNPRFSEYRVPRMADVPEIDVVLVDRRDLASIGAGETPIIAVAPALANAIRHAGGERKLTLPMLG
jgi:isoquinoline 1-oxidoreductase